MHPLLFEVASRRMRSVGPRNRQHLYLDEVYLGRIECDPDFPDKWIATAADGTCLRLRPFGNIKQATRELLGHALRRLQYERANRVRPSEP